MMYGRRAFSRVFEITESSEIGRKDVKRHALSTVSSKKYTSSLTINRHALSTVW